MYNTSVCNVRHLSGRYAAHTVGLQELRGYEVSMVWGSWESWHGRSGLRAGTSLLGLVPVIQKCTKEK